MTKVMLSRVLIVDDNSLNVELAAYVLGEAGLKVEAAEDAVAALKRIPLFQPNLILMDIQMPGMNGLELTQLLKSDAATKHIVVVAFTAYAMKGDEEKMREAGCNGYISKPIDIATFAQTVIGFLPSDAVAATAG